MTITVGTQLGSFEIIGRLGAGGMGEVWRAHDTRLNRDVAIKTLPAGLAQDTDRLARFEREAKLLAALNHPHIGAIYALDEHSGSQYLAMELIEGETLEEKLKGGALPVEDALHLALQIAQALEAAHDKGVVHRDLKPANVMITPDGVVKVLDFGLAKAFSSDKNEAVAANSPALSVAMTQQGFILGTAGYMSPEQASGQATDQRADIWAFGVVLYEMLTGLPLFSGESVPHILADVLRTEPNWDRLPNNLHPRVRSLLEHCLRKKPRNRYHAIADVRIEIEDALGDPQGVTASSAVSADAALRGRRIWMGAFAVAAVAAIGLSVPTLQHFGEPPAAMPPETRLDIVTPPTSDPGSFALSPDGHRIVFAATDTDGETRLWLRDLATTTAEPLAGTEQASRPFWSPDGLSIGFFAGSELRRLDLIGGAPQTLTRVDIGGGGSWGADDVIVFSSGPGQALMRISASGGEVSPATALAPEQRAHGLPQFLPDGRHFVFASAGTAGAQGIYLGSLDNDTQTRLASSARGLGYSPRGFLFWIDDDRLLVQPHEAARGTLTGQAVTVASGVNWLSVSASGVVAYRSEGEVRTQLQWRARRGELLGTAGDASDGLVTVPRVAPDGRRVAFGRSGEIWVQDGNRTSQITFDGSQNNWPVWSPDGARLVFGSQRSGAVNLYETQSNGTGAAQRVFATEANTIPTSWSPDGRFVLFFSVDAQQGGARLGIVPMVGERTPQLLPTTPLRGGVHAAFSPDGRWVAFQASARAGQPEVWLRPFVPPGTENAAASGQWRVSTDGGIFPAWSADSRELFYLNPDGALMAVAIDASVDAPVLGDPQRLFDTGIVGGGIDRAQSRQYDVSPDGRFLINTSLESEVAPITLMQNFDPSANR